MFVPRQQYPRELKIALMRKIDSGKSTAWVARNYQLSPKRRRALNLAFEWGKLDRPTKITLAKGVSEHVKTYFFEHQPGDLFAGIGYSRAYAKLGIPRYERFRAGIPFVSPGRDYRCIFKA